jgi:hypothetical protein
MRFTPPAILKVLPAAKEANPLAAVSLQQLTFVAIRSGHKGRDGRYYVVDFGRYITFSLPFLLFSTSYLTAALCSHVLQMLPARNPRQKVFIHT